MNISEVREGGSVQDAVGVCQLDSTSETVDRMGSTMKSRQKETRRWLLVWQTTKDRPWGWGEMNHSTQKERSGTIGLGEEIPGETSACRCLPDPGAGGDAASRHRVTALSCS